MEMSEVNPLLAKIKLPGRTFQLPSLGALYTDGEVSGTEGEIHVHPMSAMAEISLKNPDMLFNGKAIDAVFAECIPEIKKATKLFGRDIDAIMFFLRLVTYGPLFEIKVAHDCDESILHNAENQVVVDPNTNLPRHREHSYTVNIEEQVQRIRTLDPTAQENFTTTLPNGQVVTVKPIRFEHMIKLFQMNAGKKEFSEEDVKNNIIYNLTALIESVDGVTNKQHIEEWARTLTTPYQNKISDLIEKTNGWGPEQSTELKCKDCGKTFEVELPINPISFFTE